MSSSSSSLLADQIREKIKRLQKIYLDDTQIDGLEDKLIRLLRPATNSHQLEQYAIAAKQRLRQKISSHISDTSSEAHLLMKFEKECEVAMRLNRHLYSSFLIIIEPLSHSPVTKSPLYHGVGSYIKKKDKFDTLPYDINNNNHTNAASNDNTITMPPQPPARFNRNQLFNRHNNSNNNTTMHTDSSPPTTPADDFWISVETETIIIRDLIYIFQAVEAKHIKYDTRSETFLLNPDLHLPHPARDLILSLCELGYLYELVSKFIKDVTERSSSESSSSWSSKGLIVQAFGFALQEELQDYFRLLAVLEQELSQNNNTCRNNNNSNNRTNGVPSSSSSSSSVVANGSSNSTDSTNTKGLTLLRLKAWLHEPLARMTLLARLVYTCAPLIGGALISRLHANTLHGDENTQGIVQRIVHNICVPLYQAVTRWILYGELNDSNEEFFIAKRSNNNSNKNSNFSNGDNNNIWHDMYYIRTRMVPTFIPTALAMKILVIGKSINFISSYRHAVVGEVSNKDNNGNKNGNGKNKLKSKISSITNAFSNNNNKTRQTPLIQGGMQAPSISQALGYQQPQLAYEMNNTMINSQNEQNDGSINKYETLKRNAQLFAQNKVLKLSLPSSSSSPNNNDSQQAVIRGDNVNNSNNTSSNNNSSESSSLLGLTTEMESTLQSLNYGHETQLSLVVDHVLSTVNLKLLGLMMSGFHLYHHLHGLKKFMLLGQGDFVTCLMDSVGPELQKPPNKLYRHNLTGILEGALRSSNAQYEKPYVINRVLVRLLEAQPGDTGWEVFTLDYAIDAPINAVVHPEAISKYRMAFHMLWRLKRVEWTLSSSWKQLMTLSHSAWRGYGRDGRDAWRKEFPKLMQVLHRCNLSRGKMTHFVHNLGAFLMFEVMESAWLNLQTGITRAQSLDDVIKLHNDYLSDILFRGLLTQTHEVLNMQVQLLLQSIFRFCSLESALLTDATVAMSRKRLVREERERQSLLSQSQHNSKNSKHQSHQSTSSMTDNYNLLNDPLNSYDGVAESMVTRVDAAVRDYNNQFDVLMNMLRTSSESSGDFIRFLTFRLDYNNYHHLSSSQQNV